MSQTDFETSAIFTIGYGHRPIEEFVELLRSHRIEYVCDVRSRPYSRFNPDFSREVLVDKLRSHGITYVFMGDTLGGDPDDPAVRKQVGTEENATYVVDYSLARQQSRFRQGIKRLHSAWEQQLRVVLMCSESRPEQCHRVRMIGVQLAEEGIPALHIDETGVARGQGEIMRRIDNGQTTLPGLDMPSKASQSSRTWKPRDQ